MKTSKLARRLRKKEARTNLDDDNFEIFSKKLMQESYNDQFFYKELQEYYSFKVEESKNLLADFENKISSLITLLYNKHFLAEGILNYKEELKNLLDIFDNPAIKPPAGSGECSAPKLLQYAFLNDLKPLAMAEFWWGKSPNKEIRKHQQFYPACQW